jgi:hypothetical protein
VVYRLLQQPVEAAQTERIIKQLRQQPRTATHNPKDPWPPYAL